MKKNRIIGWIAMACLSVSVLSGCKKETTPTEVLTRYDAQFLDLFDTITSVVGYSKDKETFAAYVQELHDELETYHQLYDIYNNYEGINNIKTINDNAGIQPVKVDEKIIDLLDYAIEMDIQTGGKVNVAMGSVLSIWHQYRTEGIDDPVNAKLPPMEELRAASEHMDIQDVIIDREASTVYLKDQEMSLDVGAVAKGYATEQVCQKLEQDGFSKALVSVGGNVRGIGVKDDGSRWKVGIQNPNLKNDERYLHTVYVEDKSLVSSGDYQRYFTVNGKTYHHIINPDTLMPSDAYASVSILCRDSGMADALSTAVFNMDQESGMALIESLDDVEAFWVYRDGTEVFTSGFQSYLEK